jgi:hypothetical protein
MITSNARVVGVPTLEPIIRSALITRDASVGIVVTILSGDVAIYAGHHHLWG